MIKLATESGCHFPFTFYCVRGEGMWRLSTNEGHLISSPPPHSHKADSTNLCILKVTNKWRGDTIKGRIRLTIALLITFYQYEVVTRLNEKKKAKMFVCFTGDRLIVSYNGENKFNGRSWMIFHQPASQLHLIPPFIHSPASWVMIAAWCLGGGGGPKASGGGETATSSHFLPHFETFFLAANLPCFPTSCPTKARGRPVNESINGEPPTSLHVKVRNCLFSSFCLFLQ